MRTQITFPMNSLINIIRLLCLSALLVHPGFGDAGKAENTVITSDHLEMISGETENHFFFTGNVVVIGTNLKATGDKMTVIASRVGQKQSEGAVGEIGAITSILLQGNVVIEQAGRQATAGQAEIFPGEGRVILTDNPVVVDSEGRVTGYRMELLQGERKARVYGAPDSGERPRVTLPAIQDLGYQNPPSSSTNSSNR